MATAKKATAKKPTSRTTAKPVTKATSAKKTTQVRKPSATKAVKATIKKTSAKKTAGKKTAAKSADLRSFRVYRDQSDFKTFQITRQTVYWIILVAFIIFAQLWIIKLQVEIASLVEAQQTQLLEEF